MKRNFLFLCVLVLLSLSGCNLPLGQDATPVSAGPIQTWIDAPLDGGQLPLAAYEIVLHANAPQGIKSVVLMVNQQSLPVEMDLSENSMQEIRMTWLPEVPGLYTISAYTIDLFGQQDQGSQVVVEVVGQPTVGVLSPTPLTETATPMPSPTPTLIFTPTVTFSPTPAALLAGLSVSPRELVYGNCGTNQTQVMVRVNETQAISSVILFVRLRDPNSGQQTSWNSGFAMNPSSESGVFVYTLATQIIPEMDQFSAAYLEYQFVATNTSGEVIGRSPTFGDVYITQCGMIVPIFTLPPQLTFLPPVLAPTLTPIPTSTPIIIK